MDVMSTAMFLISIATVVLSILNYTMLLNKDVGMFLNYRIKEFLYALIIMVLIISLKVIFGSLLLYGIIHSPRTVRLFITLALSTYFLMYNSGLFVMLLKQGFRPVFNAEVQNVLIYTMVFYLFFDKVSISEYVDALSYVFLIFLMYTLLRTDAYLKILNMLVEPVNVVKPTKLYVLCSYLTAIACLINDLDVARSIFLLAIITCLYLKI